MTHQQPARRTVTERVTLERTIEVPLEHHEFIFTFAPHVIAPVTVGRRWPSDRELERIKGQFWNEAYGVQDDLDEWYQAGFLPNDDLGPNLVEVRIKRTQQLSRWQLGFGLAALVGLVLVRQDMLAMLVGIAVGLWLLVHMFQACFGTVQVAPVAIRVWMSRPCVDGRDVTVDLDDADSAAAPAAVDFAGGVQSSSDSVPVPIPFPASTQRHQLEAPAPAPWPRRRAQ